MNLVNLDTGRTFRFGQLLPEVHSSNRSHLNAGSRNERGGVGLADQLVLRDLVHRAAGMRHRIILPLFETWPQQ